MVTTLPFLRVSTAFAAKTLPFLSGARWRQMVILPHADTGAALTRVDTVTVPGLTAGAVALLWLVLLLLCTCCLCYGCGRLSKRCLCKKKLHVHEQDGELAPGCSVCSTRETAATAPILF